ncbi:unnamed protein product [Caenorhabditis brenneri]
MTIITGRQGSVVAVSYDMILVRFEGKGVLFKKDMLSRSFKHDDIVLFNAKKASTVDIEVGDKLSQMANYEIMWLGTDIKFIKPGRMLIAEGAVINIPDEKGQYMFVDWKYTKNPPCLPKIPGYNKPLTTNVFITRATIRPDVENLTEMFKPGQRVKFVAREQAPNERGVCWRAALATDEYHEIVMDAPTTQGRPNHRVIPKAGVIPPASGSRMVNMKLSSDTHMKPSMNTPSTSSNAALYSQRPLVKPKPLEPPKSSATSPSKSESQNCWSAPSTPVLVKPKPIDGFDYFDCSKEACAARFEHFTSDYRDRNPSCFMSQSSFENCLKIKYLNQMSKELSAIQAAKLCF